MHHVCCNKRIIEGMNKFVEGNMSSHVNGFHVSDKEYTCLSIETIYISIPFMGCVWLNKFLIHKKEYLEFILLNALKGQANFASCKHVRVINAPLHPTFI